MVIYYHYLELTFIWLSIFYIHICRYMIYFCFLRLLQSAQYFCSFQFYLLQIFFCFFVFLYFQRVYQFFVSFHFFVLFFVIPSLCIIFFCFFTSFLYFSTYLLFAHSIFCQYIYCICVICVDWIIVSRHNFIASKWTYQKKKKKFRCVSYLDTRIGFKCKQSSCISALIIFCTNKEFIIESDFFSIWATINVTFSHLISFEIKKKILFFWKFWIVQYFVSDD